MADIDDAVYLHGKIKTKLGVVMAAMLYPASIALMIVVFAKIAGLETIANISIFAIGIIEAFTFSYLGRAVAKLRRLEKIIEYLSKGGEE